MRVVSPPPRGIIRPALKTIHLFTLASVPPGSTVLSGGNIPVKSLGTLTQAVRTVEVTPRTAPVLPVHWATPIIEQRSSSEIDLDLRCQVGKKWSQEVQQCKSETQILANQMNQFQQKQEELINRQIMLARQLQNSKEETPQQNEKRLKQQLKDAQSLIPYVDPDYAYDQDNIIELAKLITLYLEDRPSDIDRNRIFQCIQNSFEGIDCSEWEYTDKLDLWVWQNSPAPLPSEKLEPRNETPDRPVDTSSVPRLAVEAHHGPAPDRAPQAAYQQT
eukprot:gene12339-15516_t